MADARLVRTCAECGQTDDHPHHIFDAAIQYVDPVTKKIVVEDRSVSRHFDCCHTVAHPCNVCEATLNCAGSKRGSDLVEYVTSKPAELHAAMRAIGIEVTD